MRQLLLMCLLCSALAATACGGTGSSVLAPSTPTAPTAAPVAATVFAGTIVGRNGQLGTISVTLQALVSATSVRPLAVAPATGSVRPAGGSSVSLTGTFDDLARAVSLAGSGYTFAGTVAGGELAGTYNGPNDAGGMFSGLNLARGAVLVYCGTAAEREGTIPFAFQISADGALTGMIFADPIPGVSGCAMTGRATGNLVTATDCEGRTNTGIIQDGTVSGRTPSGAPFFGATSQCQ